MSHKEARLHTVETVMDRLSLGRTKVYQLIESGAIRSVKVGRRRLVSESAIAEYIKRLEVGS